MVTGADRLRNPHPRELRAKGPAVPKSHASLEKAIVDQALHDPEFLAKLLADPMGFLKSLATWAGDPVLMAAGVRRRALVPRGRCQRLMH